MGDYKITFTSDQAGRCGQHTNGPDYGIVRCEHVPSRTAVEIHTHQARTPHRARNLALTLCQMAVGEMIMDYRR